MDESDQDDIKTKKRDVKTTLKTETKKSSKSHEVSANKINRLVNYMK